MNAEVLLNNIIEAYSKKKPIAIISGVGETTNKQKLVIDANGHIIQGVEVSLRGEQSIIDSVLKLMAGTQSCALMDLEVGNKCTKVIIDIVRPPRSLIIFGAGHVGNAVAVIGAFVGFEVTIIDDREAFLRSERFATNKIRPLLLSFSAAIDDDEINISEGSAVVIVTRGHQYDEICLRAMVAHNIRYLGMIGSQRRVISIVEKLVKEGISKDKLAKIHAPIGLKIGAKSPQEIAVAIVAEIIQSYNT